MTATRRSRDASAGRSRTFPAFPPNKGSRGRFASSWWGEAWVTALEQTSLDSGRLQRGRTYARGGAVDEVTVTPGRIAARVHGSRRTPYRTHVTIPQLSDAEWNRLLDTVAAQAGHIAALLDRDMPAELVQDAATAGVRLLPGIGDLDPSCSCPDWGYPCKHGAALCYQVARLLDEDPFVLLLIRGRGERELLDELQRRNAARAAAEHPSAPVPSDVEAPAETAKAVFAARQQGLPPLPEPPPLPEREAQPPTLDGLDTSGAIPDALEILVSDTALRARQLLTEASSDRLPARAARPELSEWQDAVRLCAAHPDTGLLTRITAGTGRSAHELAQAVRAWRYGGANGLAVLEEPWTPAADESARARAQLKDDWPADTPRPRLRTRQNRWTIDGHNAQLRLGRDHRWYPYRKESGIWWPSGPPETDIAVALATLLHIDA